VPAGVAAAVEHLLRPEGAGVLLVDWGAAGAELPGLAACGHSGYKNLLYPASYGRTGDSFSYFYI